MTKLKKEIDLITNTARSLSIRYDFFWSTVRSADRAKNSTMPMELMKPIRQDIVMHHWRSGMNGVHPLDGSLTISDRDHAIEMLQKPLLSPLDQRTSSSVPLAI